jgi:hypothetical protein
MSLVVRSKEGAVMPWELRIVKTIGQPPTTCPDNDATETLGPIGDVHLQLSTALPGIEFYNEPGGAEKLDMMLRKGIDIPDSLKTILATANSSSRGVYDGEDYRFEFSFGNQPLVDHAFLDVRGGGNPMPALARVIGATGWAIYDLATSKMVDVSGWDKFTEWRNRGIQSSQRGEGDGRT